METDGKYDIHSAKKLIPVVTALPLKGQNSALSWTVQFILQRYRKEESSSESEDDYVPYVPVRERKKQQLKKLGRLSQVSNILMIL